MMLAPCSASSMLSASLRPGQWPGLRALTMPARGTDWQLRDGGRSDEDYNDVDDQVDRAYGGLITSVPHGTPPVRHNGIRSAHSADAPRARLERTLHDIAVRYSGLCRCCVRRTTRRHEAAFTGARSRPGLTERSIDGRITNATVAARSTALADRCRHSARIRAHQHGASTATSTRQGAPLTNHESRASGGRHGCARTC